MLKTISSREVYRNPWCTVREDVTERPDGTRGIYGVMDKPQACIVVPIEHAADGDYVWLVHQYRYTVGASFFELPQGGWESDDIDPEELARGELREETGMSAGRMTLIGKNWIAYGAMRQLHSVYLAEELVPGETDRDAEEWDMTVHRVAVSDFEAMILDGRVMDNCSIAAWGMYRLWREQRG
ncbi:NUDIX domain-containing protein [Granulicella cerasi]|uniref:GDP-mannose pyrophosphatase n=1 Tax=Granulicella cerasi TaxID=741063 RepID=A0ABW1Z8K9_9BACT|nr:NUDIX hydrolase [Granulicella cerasi]